MMGVLVLVLLSFTVGVALSANPNYSYHVKIDDAAHANFQEKAETRKGPDAVGFYSVVEPNGALRTVQYTANDDGFNPIVSYSHGGNSVYVNGPGPASSIVGTYAPAYVQDQRVQIVNKGVAPALALQPQAVAIPVQQPQQIAVQHQHYGLPTGPLVVPAPLRAAPAPELIVEARGVEYAPAYMPHVTAFIQHQPQAIVHAQPPPPVYGPPQVQVIQEQPRPVYGPPQVLLEQPRPVYGPPPPQPKPVYGPPLVQPGPLYGPPQLTYLPPPPPKRVVAIQPVKTYLPPPPPQPVYISQPIKTYLPPKLIYQQQPTLIVKKPAVLVSKPAPVTVIQDSYAVPPQNTVTDPNGPVYPDSKPNPTYGPPKNTYGPPNFTPGIPLTTVDPPPAIVVRKKPVKVHVTVVSAPPELDAPPPPPPVRVVQPLKVVQPLQIAQPVKYFQYAPQYVPVVPQVQKVVLPQPQQFLVQQPEPQQILVQQPQIQVHQQPLLQVQKVVAPPPVIGYHTQNSGPAAYLHSYGSPTFHVTSQRQYNKAVLPLAVQQPQQVLVPQPQQVYAPQYIAAAKPVAVAPPPPPPPQLLYGAPTQTLVEQPQPVYGTPIQTAPPPQAPVAVAVGKKQNPLTFAYSYDQGGAKVSHSYSGSGW